ncbi:hypothetical protein [Haliangium sp.]|uniref:hypothetical protein n=1 Tax=Haliangium sp. TaxID=2663208 RepID=UPI003D0B3AE0
MNGSLPLLLVVAAAVSAGGCRRAQSWQEREVDYGLVQLDTAHMRIRHDVVGHDDWEGRASFVLIDAENRHDQDLMVTLEGSLRGADGTVLGPLRPASLRIPAGGVRTFALVEAEQREHAATDRAEVRVVGAFVPQYPPPVVVTDGHVYRDGDRVVVSGRVRNTGAGPVRALVIAGFYDRDGRPMTRPFTSMYIPGEGDHTAQFVGPPGSVKGYLFIGDLVY